MAGGPAASEARTATVSGGRRSARAASGNGAAPSVELAVAGREPPAAGRSRPGGRAQGGDRSEEVSALTDLGIIILSEGDARGAIVRLEEALALVRQVGDADRESDIMGNLGMALLYVQQPVRGRQLFEYELAHARSTGDVLAQKVAMERMGLVVSMMGDPRGAVNWFEQALGLARQVGDHHQEANLLWLQAIQLAELNQRDAAIARAQESIALFSKLGKPQASWYGAYLQKYRMGLFDTWPSLAAAGVSPGPGAYLGGALVASVVASQVPGQGQATPQQTTGPGLLRMAMSATKSMAQFAGSGFRTTPPEVQRRRIQTCADVRAPHRHALQDLRLLHRRQEPPPARVLPDRQVAGMRGPAIPFIGRRGLSARPIPTGHRPSSGPGDGRRSSGPSRPGRGGATRARSGSPGTRWGAA